MVEMHSYEVNILRSSEVRESKIYSDHFLGIFSFFKTFRKFRRSNVDASLHLIISQSFKDAKRSYLLVRVFINIYCPVV